MRIPTDAFSLVIWLVDMGLLAISLSEATNRLRSGLAAQAEREQRDVTPEELAVIKQLEDEAEKRMKGS